MGPNVSTILANLSAIRSSQASTWQQPPSDVRITNKSESFLIYGNQTRRGPSQVLRTIMTSNTNEPHASFELVFHVLPEDIDQLHHVNNVVYLR